MLRDDFPNRNLICMLHHLFCSSLLHFVVDKTKDFNIYGILKKEKKKKKEENTARQAGTQAGRQAGGRRPLVRCNKNCLSLVIL